MTTETIGPGTTMSAGYGQITQTGLSLTNQGVLGAAGAAYGVIVDSTGDAIYNSGKILAAAAFAKGIFANQSVRVTNLSGGTISGGYGLYLLAGGSVSNASGALITGAKPIFGSTNPLAVRNLGVILGTGTSSSQPGLLLKAGGDVYNGPGATISGGGGGSGVYEGALSTVRNSGSIRSNNTTQGLAGVTLNAGGTVTNSSKAAQPVATISGAYGGVMIRNGSGYVYNYKAQITGGVAGAFLLGGGSLTNEGGTIAANYAVAIGGGYGLVLNDGVIQGGNLGVGLSARGRVINSAGETIVGAKAVSISGGAGTVWNYGQINAGTAGYAVTLTPGFNNLVLVGPGAGFTGTVTGGNTVGAANSSILELQNGTAAGTIGSLGTQIIDFNQIQVQPAAVWSITSGSVALGTTVVVDPAATLTNQATIQAQVTLIGYYATDMPGVRGPEVVNAAGGTIGAGTASSPIGIYDPHSGPGNITLPADTIVNDGKIQAATGIKLVPQGVVTNQAQGVIQGIVPLFFKGSATVTNLGLLLSTTAASVAGVYLGGGGTVINQGTAAITGGRGVRAPGSATVENYAAIEAFGSTAPLVVEGSASAARAGVLLGGGFVTNGSTAVIQGPHFGVGIGYKTSTKGSVVNAGTINAYQGLIANNAAVYLFNGGAVTNQSGGLITAVGTGNVFGVRFHGASGSGLATGTLVNQGSISVPTGFGFYSNAGGAVSNTGTGAITALAPIKIQHGIAYVDNQGMISGSTSANGIGVLIGYGTITNGSKGTITAATAVEMNYESGTVTNSGSIGGNSLGAGVYLGPGGSVTNQASAHITGGIGVSMQGDGLVANSGTIGGVTEGITLAHGGAISNTGSGVISGTIGGIGVSGVSGGSITNHHIISGGTYGVSLATGGSVSNFSGGTISGSSLGVGIQGGGAVYNTAGGTIRGANGVSIAGGPGTVQNYGYIYGGFILNQNHYVGVAVALASGFTNRLMLQPGASFFGGVDGGNMVGATAISTLELRAGTAAGTLVGLSDDFINFTNFANFLVDQSSVWTLANGGTIGSGTTVSDSGALTNDGEILATVTLPSVGGVLTNATGASITASQSGVLATAALATVVNYGIMRGTANASYGIRFTDGGTVTNQSQGTITAATAIYVGGAVATVANSGQILGFSTSHFEVSLSAGGTIQNLGGTIDGGAGVYMRGGPAAVVNTGKIAAEDANPVALELSPGFADQLSITPGAVFGGKVDGGNTIGATSASTLEMMSGTSAGTISGIGAKYYNFTGFTVASAATWILTGANSIGTGGSLFVAGTAINQGSFQGNASVTGGGFLSNASAVQISGATPVSAAYQQNGQAVTLTNSGTISGTATSLGAGAVSLAQNAVVTNQQNAVIRGAQFGVRAGPPAVAGGQPNVVNDGSIITNGTSILGQPTLYGAVQFSSAGGVLTNGQGAQITASIGYGVGFGATGNGLVTNLGTINGPVGIVSHGLLRLSNASNAVISATGPAIAGSYVSVANQGLITSSSTTALQSGQGGGSRITNQSGGTIRGVNGVFAGAYNGENTVTVVNAGLIATTGPSGYAVLFGHGGPGVLVDEPGATFIGQVNGGNAIGSNFVSTLELASAASAGTLTGLGSQFTDFASVTADANAQWALTGQNSLATKANMLLNGALDVGGVFLVDGGIGVEDGGKLAVAGGRMIVENQGTILNTQDGNGIEIGHAAAGGAGEVDVTGTKSTIANTESLFVGDDAQGTLNITSGGTVSESQDGAVGMEVGVNAGASGSSVNVTGAGSNLRITGSLLVSNAGFGQLSVSQGAMVSATTLDLAAAAGGNGVVSVVGTGSALALTGGLTVGDQGAGEVSILGGAIVSALSVSIGGASALSSGNVDIEGAGSELSIGTGGVLNIGVAGGGSGVLTIGAGTTLQSNAGVVENGHASFNNNGGVVDPPFVDLTTQSNSGLGSNLYDLYVENIGAVQIVSGTGTWDTPMMLTGTSVSDAQNNINVNGDQGEWQLSSGGTLIVNANTVDAGQAIVFEDATDTLVIGQIVNNGSAGVSGTAPVVTPGAENLLQAGGFAAEIWGYVAGDKIQFDNMPVSSASVVNGNTVDLFGPGNVSLGSLAFFTKSGSKVSDAGATAAAAQMPVQCFAAGTRIETANGLVRVEDLRVGDLLVTADGGAEPIVWLGQREVDCARHPRPETAWPVRVAADAFGAGTPCRDLYLSPDHAVFVNDVLVPVKLLLNGTTIVQTPRPRVRYFHVELPEHAVILAEGLPVESYLDSGDRMDFDGATTRLFPAFGAARWETRGCAPLVLTGEALRAARGRVAQRMASMPRSHCRAEAHRGGAGQAPTSA